MSQSWPVISNVEVLPIWLEDTVKSQSSSCEKTSDLGVDPPLFLYGGGGYTHSRHAIFLLLIYLYRLTVYNNWARVTMIRIYLEQ